MFVYSFVCLFTVPDSVRQQYEDNCQWIREAGKHQLVGLLGNIVSQRESNSVLPKFLHFLSVYLSVKVVGSQARILYSNEEGRVSIALAFNKAVSDGRLKVHLVSSTDCIIVSLLSVFISLIPRPSLSFSMPAAQIAKDRSWAGTQLGMKPPHAQWHIIK